MGEEAVSSVLVLFYVRQRKAKEEEILARSAGKNYL